MKQLNSLDYLKAYAIIAVLFLHLLPYNYLIKTFAQFHIWQAVPIFVLLMGYTFTLSFNKVSFEKSSTMMMTNNIMTINDYVKMMVLSYQSKYPDTELSKKLGISRKSLWEKRKKLGIEKKK